MINFGKISYTNTSKPIVLEKLENGCIICTSHCKDSCGYTRIRYNGKHERLFRVLYKMQYGEIPKGKVIRHKCDNPSCCNIEHLEIGTQKDNVQDMIDRGRTLKNKSNIKIRGVNNGSNKLTMEQVKEIYLSDLSYNKLSKLYNVSRTNISLIKKQKQWAWLTSQLN